MHRGRRLAVGVVAAVVAGTLGLGSVEVGAAGTALPSARTTWLKHPVVGVEYHALWGDRTDADRRDMFDRLARMGVGWVRISFPWGLAQNERPKGGNPGWNEWGLERVDRVVRMARRRGLEISFTLWGTPSWANGGLGTSYLPTDPDSYARVLRFLAKRYRGQVGSWEIWNEPDHPKFLKGATAADYTRLLCRAYPAVHQGDPGALVVTGGTGGNDWPYLRRMYRAGAKGCFDVVGTHPYAGDHSPYRMPTVRPWWPRSVFMVHRLMKRRGDGGKPIWFTESGWSTHPDPPVFSGSEDGVTLAQQARFLVQLLTLTDARYPYVERVSWYMAKAEAIGDVHDNQFGLYTYDMRPKPAVRALRTYLSNLS
jgi:polysaccharide biosynthesis protein PslG